MHYSRLLLSFYTLLRRFRPYSRFTQRLSAKFQDMYSS